MSYGTSIGVYCCFKHVWLHAVPGVLSVVGSLLLLAAMLMLAYLLANVPAVANVSAVSRDLALLPRCSSVVF